MGYAWTDKTRYPSRAQQQLPKNFSDPRKHPSIRVSQVVGVGTSRSEKTWWDCIAFIPCWYLQHWYLALTSNCCVWEILESKPLFCLHVAAHLSSHVQNLQVQVTLSCQSVSDRFKNIGIWAMIQARCPSSLAKLVDNSNDKGFLIRRRDCAAYLGVITGSPQRKKMVRTCRSGRLSLWGGSTKLDPKWDVQKNRHEY